MRGSLGSRRAGAAHTRPQPPAEERPQQGVRTARVGGRSVSASCPPGAVPEPRGPLRPPAPGWRADGLSRKDRRKPPGAPSPRAPRPSSEVPAWLKMRQNWHVGRTGSLPAPPRSSFHGRERWGGAGGEKRGCLPGANRRFLDQPVGRYGGYRGREPPVRLKPPVTRAGTHFPSGPSPHPNTLPDKQTKSPSSALGSRPPMRGAWARLGGFLWHDHAHAPRVSAPVSRRCGEARREVSRRVRARERWQVRACADTRHARPIRSPGKASPICVCVA